MQIKYLVYMVLQFISIFCPVDNGALAVICPVGVRLLSASEFGSAPVIELVLKRRY